MANAANSGRPIPGASTVPTSRRSYAYDTTSIRGSATVVLGDLHTYSPTLATGTSRAVLGDTIYGDVFNFHHTGQKDRSERSYTVAWFCATTAEVGAARCMLDEEHSKSQYLERPRSGNFYTLGRIGIHNLVIACVPGSNVVASIAILVAETLYDFPDIRFGLLVGVGSGVPSQSKDVRLGDVVVGDGVIQYQVSGRRQMSGLQRFGSLNPPPTILLAAAATLKGLHEREDASLSTLIENATLHDTWLQERYSYPGAEHDNLFEPSASHADCQPNGECDVARSIPRPQRDPHRPVIHYGSIASGNEVVRNTLIRDGLREELGVLCIETEGAGLMNDFPCIMVRGIADYADSHANNKFRGYAALAASACAKELLLHVSENRGMATTTAAEVLDLDLTNTQATVLSNEISDTSSQASTSVGSLEPGLIEAVLDRIVQAIVSDRAFKPLYNLALLRMSKSVFQRNLNTSLGYFARSLRKFAVTPLEQAIAWMLRTYRLDLVLRITRTISPEGDIEADAPQRLDQLPLSRQQQIMQLIKEKFTTPQQTSDNAQDNASIERDRKFPLKGEDQTEEKDNEDKDENEEEEEEQEPDADDLQDLDQISRVISSGVVYEQVYNHTEALLFPSPDLLIQKVLNRHVPKTDGLQTVVCLIEWHLLEYLETEDITIDDLDSTMTLTGKLDCACAARLIDYISISWDTGVTLLQSVKASIKRCLSKESVRVDDILVPTMDPSIKVEVFSEPGQRSERAVVSICGNFGQISQTLEQLAWLTATLRPPIEGQLTVSDITFTAHKMEFDDLTESSSQFTVFHLGLHNQDKVLQAKADKHGQCWTPLFTQSVLSYGFRLPGPARPEGVKGLEIPFELMAAFAGVQFPISIQDRLAFANTSSMLIPVDVFEGSVQWHFAKSEDWHKSVKSGAKLSHPNMDFFDASKLVQARAFLGYWKNCEVLLGTANSAQLRVTESGVRQTGPKMTVELEGPLNASVSGQGYATVSAGSKWRLNRGETALIAANELSPNEKVKRSAREPVLLYDQETCVALLVPELSIVLQMVASYLRSESQLEIEKIPLAKPAPDGGIAAYETIKGAAQLEVPFGIGEKRKYIEIVESFLKIFEQRKAQTAVLRKISEMSLKKGLRGWDYTEVQEKARDISERELPTSILRSRPIWWKLFKPSGTLILFARLSDLPIQSGLHGIGDFDCRAWIDIPRDSHLLLANMVQLQTLRNRLCQEGPREHPRRYMLSNKLAWARPRDSRLFEQTCTQGGSCNPVQTMCKVSFNRKKYKQVATKVFHRHSPYDEHPGADVEEAGAAGAVLFADDPSIFTSRPCQTLQPVPEPLVQHDLRIVVLSIILPFILAFGLAKGLHILQRSQIYAGDPANSVLELSAY